MHHTYDLRVKFPPQLTARFLRFNADMELQYRCRLDASRTMLVPDARRELFEAMCQIAETGKGPAEQQASNGLLDQAAGESARIVSPQPVLKRQTLK
jgi:hypothetical protein